MTRPSKRELARDVADLSPDQSTDSDPLIVWEHPETGERFDVNGVHEDPLNPTAVDPLMVIETARDTRTPDSGVDA
jgi:hypothetical protein